MHLGKSDKHCTALQDAGEASGSKGIKSPSSSVCPAGVCHDGSSVSGQLLLKPSVKRILHRHRWAVDQCRSGRMARVGDGGEAMKNPSCGLGRDKPILPR
jgi:hypothetical protein